MAISCSNCGKELPDGAKFCVQCGTQVAVLEEKAKPRFCDSCGVQLLEDAKFCLECGTPVPTEEKNPFYQERDEEFDKEMYKYSPLFDEKNTTRILDFEIHQGEIRRRAKLWAEHYASKMTAPEWFDWLLLGGIMGYEFLVSPANDLHFYSTNKPNAHEALLQRTMDEWFIEESRRRGYIDYEGHYSPTVLAYFKATGRYNDDSIEDFRCKVDFSKLDERARLDDEKFPPPEPIRAEAAGAILNFTTDDAILVVYADCSQKGKTVEVAIEEYPIGSDVLLKAEIIERTIGNTTICAAIFRPISFATDKVKNRYHYKDAPKQTKATLRCYFSSSVTTEEVMLFKGNVTELDWRGKK